MLSFLLIISTISGAENIYPTAMLIDESSEQYWHQHKIDRSLWAATADSELTSGQANEGPISNILTGDSTKIWLTKIDESGHIGPFKFTINLNKRTSFKAFSLMPRQSGTVGKMKVYEFYAAQNEDELNAKIQIGKYLSKGTIDPEEVKSTLVILPYTISASIIAVRSLNQPGSASLAEFNLYEDPDSSDTKTQQIYIKEQKDKHWLNYKIDRTGWTVTANSENGPNGNDGPASYMLDGDTNKMWHSSYNSGHNDRNNPSDPFIATINLGKETTFKAFSYMPRQNTASTNGNFRHYEFYVAHSQEELNTKIQNSQYAAKGDIDHTLTLSTLVIFSTPLTGSFVALVSLNHDSYAICVEFNLYNESLDFFFLEKVERSDNSWNSYKIDRNGWTATASSEQASNGNEGPVSFMIDDNINTFWHSHYTNKPESSTPIIATINLGKETTFDAFSYMPRTGDGTNGKFRRFEFYTAQTQEELDNKISETLYSAKGEIDRSSDSSTFVVFEKPLTATFVALASIDHDRYATCCDFNLYSGIPVIPPTYPAVPTQISTKATINEATDTFWTAFQINRSGWKVRANSEEYTTHSNGDPAVTAILDGNPNTWWHSKYSNTNSYDDRYTNEPFHFTIDLGQETTFKALSYRPRTGTGDNGMFKRFEFYAANTSEELFIKIMNRNHINDNTVDHQTRSSTFIIFKELQVAKHIGVLVTDRVNNYASCGEFNLYTEPPPVEADQSVMTNQERLINITCDKFVYENWPDDGRCVSSGTANHGSFVGAIGAKAKVTFFGIKAHLLVRKEGSAGIAYVRIDDTVVAIVDFKAYSGGSTNCIIYSSNELDYGEHTIEVESLSTSTIVVGAVYVNPLPKEHGYVLGFSDFKQNEGDWTQDSSSTPPIFSSVNDPASGTFEFYGTRFYLTGVRGSSVGNMEISIDDGDFITISESKNEAVAQNNKAIKLYDSGIIDFKMHSVKIRRSDSQISIMNLLYTWYPNTETPVPTQSATESPTQSATESATESPTQSATESATQSATESATQSPTQSATESATQSATESATQSPSQSPSQSPTETPSQSLTPVTPTPATPTPTPIVEEVIFDDNNYTESRPDRDRIEKEIPNDDSKSISVVVKKSEFINNTNDYGGAIHLVNCGLKTDGNIFRECTSNKGAGGAIYIENKHEAQNDVNFINLQIIQCSAEYGGGAYIYSNSVKNNVDIINCLFKENVATRSESTTKLYGGSAMFLTVKKSRVRKCTFESNDIKLINDFSKSSSSLSILEDKASLLLLTECNFKISENMKYSLFYYGGDHSSEMKLMSCSFYGKLNQNAYFIDGQLTNKNSPKLIVKSCRFSSSSRKALNQNGQFASIDLKDQIFEASEFEESGKKKLNVNSVIIISVAVIAAIIVLIITIIVVVKKRTNPNVYSIEYDGIEMSSNSTNISLNTPLI